MVTTTLLIFVCVVFVSSFELTIIHFNDLHSYFDERSTENDGRGCPGERWRRDAYVGCFGGLARMVTKVKEIREQKDNTLFLFGGDAYQGTAWFTMFKSEVVSFFMNKLGLDAAALGNHEFDYGPDELSPYVRDATFPILCCNIDVEDEDYLNDGHIQKSKVFTIEGKKVGVIGYITPDTEFIASPGDNVRFMDDADAIAAEAQDLVNDGVDIIIALGHSGYIQEQGIVGEVGELDFLVGAHSHSFLASEGQGDFPDVPEGPYPTVVTREDGSKVPIVQAFMYGKYLGNITLQFDDDCQLVSWEGAPIFLDDSVEKDPEMEAHLAVWRERVGNEIHREIGESRVFLNAIRAEVRVQETNLGNFITDGMLAEAHKNGYNDVSIAILNGGGIRNSVQEGEITMEDIMTVLPFNNFMDVFQLKGEYLFDMFEHSVDELELQDGRFLQVSGIWVRYNDTKPKGERVRSLKVKENGVLVPVDKNKMYGMITIRFLRSGKAGYDMLGDHSVVIKETDWNDLEILESYIKEQSPINIQVQNRIVFGEEEEEEKKESKKKKYGKKTKTVINQTWKKM